MSSGVLPAARMVKCRMGHFSGSPLLDTIILQLVSANNSAQCGPSVLPNPRPAHGAEPSSPQLNRYETPNCGRSPSGAVLGNVLWGARASAPVPSQQDCTCQGKAPQTQMPRPLHHDPRAGQV